MSDSNLKLALFKVEYISDDYYTLTFESGRNDLDMIFIKYEQTHACSFEGPKEWTPSVLKHFIKLFRMFEVRKVEGVVLYSPIHINEIWALLKSELSVINEACKTLNNE